MTKVKFKKPQGGHYFVYCYQCKHYEFERQVGCAYLGKCYALGEPVEADAYDPPCGLWKPKYSKGE